MEVGIWARQWDEEYQRERGLSHNEQDKKRRIHDNLRDLIKKYEEMALRLGTPSSMDNLLSSTKSALQ